MSRLSGPEPSEWLREHVTLEPSSSAAALYDHMESQSGGCLPVIYEPFDGTRRGHFVDCGQILDYAIAAGGGRVLDFGPGDGWPSLLLAPFVEEVVGVDGSQRRVDVCTRNARRLDIGNSQFEHVEPGAALPFDDDSFDAIIAASSVEQTPDPRATIAELYRVLKPGGRLRMYYESLGYYRQGRERELWVSDTEPVSLLVYDRSIEDERVCHYCLRLDASKGDVEAAFERHGADLCYSALSPQLLEELCARLIGATTWTTLHPSCRTWLRWLDETGFTTAQPTQNGGTFAGRLFTQSDESRRPVGRSAIDAFLRPLVEVIVTLTAPDTAPPRQWEPWITAVK